MSDDRPVRVAIVDDNELIRMGLQSMLGADPRIEVAGEAGDGAAAVALITRERPEVTLLDVRMPIKDGVAVARECADLTRVIMMTYADTADIVQAAMAAGAVGYLIHGQFRAEDLVSTVLSTAAGNSTFSAAAMQALTAPPVVPAAAERPDFGLSRRQVEIMEAIASGKTNGEIASEFYLAEKTVKNHVNQIFSRLRVRARAEAVAVWLGHAER